MTVLIAEQERMKTLQRGFTLMEMMVVLAIIAILALMAVPSYMDLIVWAANRGSFATC